MSNTNRTTPTASAAKSLAVTARESTESIVVAFALAFIFRAFIVEAFIIPTGSMAPTLYGQQITYTCSTCGFEYAHGVDQAPRPYDLTLKCPNCASTADQIPGQELVHPYSGDRILVHKWPFSVGGPIGPKRWGVTVFKDPHNGTVNFIKRLVGLPGEFLEIIHGDVYTASLEQITKKDPDLITQMDQLRRDLYHHAHGGPTLQYSEVSARYKAINTRLIPYLKIQRKAVTAPDAQKSLWFNVFNQDFFPVYHTKVEPENVVGWSALLLGTEVAEPEQLNNGRIPPELRKSLEGLQIKLPETAALVTEEAGRKWRVGDLLIVRDESHLSVYDAAAAAAWDVSQREIGFDPDRFHSDTDRVLDVRFTGKPIDDFYAYNFGPNSQNPAHSPVPVGDLRLAFTWFPDSGNGGLVLEMNRDRDTFVARIQMDGSVEIDHLVDGGKKPSVIGKDKLEPFGHGKAALIEFVNVDFRVSLTINGREVLASTDQQYTPDVAKLLQWNEEDPDRSAQRTVPSHVKIGAYKMHCRLRHVELDRDEYYRSSLMLERVSASADPDQPLATNLRIPNPFLDWPGWGTQGWPIMLRDNEAKEYFMLGDNSPGSKDSRLWWEIGPHLQQLGEQYQVGTVPDDQLIGRAFFVYWPSGYRRSWTNDIGIIPNFGRMRWIR